MMALDSRFAPFSQAAFDPAARSVLHSRLLVDGGKAWTASFLRCHGGDVARGGSGLVDVLSEWSGSEATIGEAMQLPLALRGARAAAIDPVWVAAQFAAHLHSE